MTTIVAIESEESVIFAYDSQTSVGYHGFKMHEDAQKVFQNGELVFGSSGSVLDSQIIEFMQIPKIKKSHTGNLDAWVTNRFIPAVRDALAEHAALEVRNQQAETGCHFLVCVRGRVYEVYSNLAWCRRKDGIYTIGSGSHYARGALEAGASVRQAVKIARNNDNGTGGKIKVVEVVVGGSE